MNSFRKLPGFVEEKLSGIDWKKVLVMNIPYLIVWYLVNRLSWLYGQSEVGEAAYKISYVFLHFSEAFSRAFPSFHPKDVLVGMIAAVAFKGFVYLKSKEAKKFRHGVEYGSARWGNAKDIAPYEDKENEDNNILLTATEKLTMSSRPKNPKYARNKNCVVIGGSGSGKTRFFVKPQLMQLHSSYVVTDPKGTLLVETGNMLQKNGYELKVLNTINFSKSMHYNPFKYARHEVA